MGYGSGGKVPLPTKSEIDEAHALDREVVACSAVRYGPMTYMKVAFHNGDTSTVWLGSNGAFRLLRALKAIVPDTPHVGASLLSEIENGHSLQEGHMSG
jgi:hypothetical protein